MHRIRLCCEHVEGNDDVRAMRGSPVAGTTRSVARHKALRTADQTKYDAVMAGASRRGRAQIDSRADRDLGAKVSGSRRVLGCCGWRRGRQWCGGHAPRARPARGALRANRFRPPGSRDFASTRRSAHCAPAARHDVGLARREPREWCARSHSGGRRMVELPRRRRRRTVFFFFLFCFGAFRNGRFPGLRSAVMRA